MNNKSASARVLPILGFQTVINTEEMTLREFLKIRLGLDIYNLPPSETERFPGRDAVGVDANDLSGDFLLVRLNGDLIIMPRDECEKIARRKGLRLAGTNESPDIELLGTIAFSRTCYTQKDCSRCQLCDFPVAG